MKKLKYLVIFLPMFLFAQNKGETIVSKQSLKEIQLRIAKLEKNVDDGNVAIDNAKTMIDISKGYSGTANDLVTRWSALFAIIVAFSGGIGFYVLKKSINTQLKGILNQKEEIITELFYKHQLEKGIITKNKILIINKADTTVNKYLEEVLKKFANKIVKENIVNLLTHTFDNEFKDFDLVLFDNTNTNHSSKDWNFKGDENIALKDKLIEIAKGVCSKNVAFFFFGGKDDKFVDSLSDYAHLINFSNSPSTAYSNIINLLNFRELLIKS